MREDYISNKELIKDYQKDYYEKNKDVILNKVREYYINNKKLIKDIEKVRLMNKNKN